jgi:hypothetical protein
VGGSDFMSDSIFSQVGPLRKEWDFVVTGNQHSGGMMDMMEAAETIVNGMP